MFMVIILFNFLSAQDLFWEKINSIPEGYHYVMGLNVDGEMVAAGEFNFIPVRVE